MFSFHSFCCEEKKNQLKKKEKVEKIFSFSFSILAKIWLCSNSIGRMKKMSENFILYAIPSESNIIMQVSYSLSLSLSVSLSLLPPPRQKKRVMTALQDTPVPVPKTYGLCKDPSVIGQMFYVMEFVEVGCFRYAYIKKILEIAIPYFF